MPNLLGVVELARVAYMVEDQSKMSFSVFIGWKTSTWTARGNAFVCDISFLTKPHAVGFKVLALYLGWFGCFSEDGEKSAYSCDPCSEIQGGACLRD